MLKNEEASSEKFPECVGDVEFPNFVTSPSFLSFFFRRGGFLKFNRCSFLNFMQIFTLLYVKASYFKCLSFRGVEDLICLSVRNSNSSSSSSSRPLISSVNPHLLTPVPGLPQLVLSGRFSRITSCDPINAWFTRIIAFPQSLCQVSSPWSNDRSGTTLSLMLPSYIH